MLLTKPTDPDRPVTEQATKRPSSGRCHADGLGRQARLVTGAERVSGEDPVGPPRADSPAKSGLNIAGVENRSLQ
jgi:hypothetical protein